MNRQVCLRSGREPLQIAYPEGFSGVKFDPESTEINISREMRLLSQDEIAVVERYLDPKNLPYKQSLNYGAIMVDQDDPLLQIDHDALNQVEKDSSLASTEFAIGGGRRSLYERVLILRESGFAGNGSKSLSPA